MRFELKHALVQAYMKINTPEIQDKAWQIVKLMEIVRAIHRLFRASTN